MKITIEGASPEFERGLLALFAEHLDELTLTADTEWDAERAEHYLRSLPAGAREFARIVVIDGDGRAEAETLREQLGKLQGPTVALSRAIPRGVREGRWPEGTSQPITVVYDPDNPSWQKAIAYEMTRANVPFFRTAFARLAHAKQQAESLGLTPGGAGKTTMSRTLDPQLTTRGYPGVTPVDVDGGARPADGDQDETEQP